uniref:Uncharacterized protein n=1 Tax=Setaria viridis TaxID=4556 RepID=A0A4U6USS8_SETVI|nr:hypothetical protein SEVIR_5G431750v2 [Setaria viridis]
MRAMAHTAIRAHSKSPIHRLLSLYLFLSLVRTASSIAVRRGESQAGRQLGEAWATS